MTDQSESWIIDGRDDIALWARHGLGIELHAKQLEMLDALQNDPASMYLLYWANRAGKTIGVIVWHLHAIFYKPELKIPKNEYEQGLWVAEDYRTLHCAPIGDLATVAWEAIDQIAKGTHPVQRDLETGERRAAPLGYFFVPGVERDKRGADHLVVRSLNGGLMDIRSTEGGAGRLEGRAWRRISWDEWPQQDAADKPAAIRKVLTRLQNRASDFDAPILLTGTITEETEHIATEWIHRCEDPQDIDWWGSEAARTDNPAASRKAMAMAERNMDPEDYARTVMGRPGGVKGRLIPSFMVEPVFTRSLSRFTAPHPDDGVAWVPNQAPAMARSRRRDEPEDERPVQRGSFRPRGDGSPFTYLHIWDLAIAAAVNIGHVWRLPADWRFGWSTVDGKRLLRAIEGVKRVEVAGTRTLTDDEIIHTIEETYLPYGGRIIVDATDAHGKNIERSLRRAGYPVEGFGFQERDQRKVIRKDAAVLHTRELLVEGMEFKRDAKGEILYLDDLPVWQPDVEYGVLRLPADWVKARDQLSILRPDDTKQVKDEAMVVLMGCDTAYRMRRSRTRRVDSQHFAVFARRGVR